MKMSELKTLLQTGKDVDVEFTKDVEDLEGYAEPGMRATIISVSPVGQDDVMKIRVSYKKYDDFNRAFEAHNYWGRLSLDQDPSAAAYTARETGWYKEEEDIYVMADDVLKYMTVLEPNEMFDTWNASLKQVSYVTWLENRIRLLEKQLNSVDSLTQLYDNPSNN